MRAPRAAGTAALPSLCADMPCAVSSTCDNSLDAAAHRCSKFKADEYRACSLRIPGTRHMKVFDDRLYYCSSRCSEVQSKSCTDTDASRDEGHGRSSTGSRGKTLSAMSRKAKASSLASKNRAKASLAVKYALKFGLKIHEGLAENGEVISVRCLFCVHFRRESFPGGERKRKIAGTEYVFWKLFRIERFKENLYGQHTERWNVYKGLDSAAKNDLFAPRVHRSKTILK